MSALAFLIRWKMSPTLTLALPWCWCCCPPSALFMELINCHWEAPSPSTKPYHHHHHHPADECRWNFFEQPRCFLFIQHGFGSKISIDENFPPHLLNIYQRFPDKPSKKIFSVDKSCPWGQVPPCQIWETYNDPVNSAADADGRQLSLGEIFNAATCWTLDISRAGGISVPPHLTRSPLQRPRLSSCLVEIFTACLSYRVVVQGSRASQE